MKTKIDKNGYLQLEKLGKMWEQFCPYSATNDWGHSNCGLWCPLFRIEEIGSDFFIELCHKKYRISQKDFTMEK